ncbi:MAG: methyltransferase domain-containing protein [Verrucomicrobia bacterium]|jgi:cyclopropane-fatty-acyl-phospholipid synthase|nr:methyltransferase domain-containing protein [Verrucomicrobiota bacterium]
MSIGIQLAERGLVGDRAIRAGIRKLLRERLKSIAENPKSSTQWMQTLESLPLAVDTDAANEQHYEIPAAYFQRILGKHLKYSAGYWPDGVAKLDEAEAAMLALSCERAELADGQRILELGCGWGSLSLWMAECYPSSEIVAISNSQSQRAYIEAEAAERGLPNLRVVTCDINDFQPEGTFDRVVSVEMFEHVRNHNQLLGRVASWLRPGGQLFVHIFTHRAETYLFEAKSSKDWMSKYFFTGGIMPAVELLPTAARGHLEEVARWTVNGLHYSRTLESWLANQDANQATILEIFRECYGAKRARLWAQRWRIFYMACSELFAYNNGKEWPVTHYRFVKPE